MVHDYASGLHYSIVENGGFLRNGLGLSHQQWVHLHTLERGNLVASRVMGSVEYMRMIRQRYGAQRQADDTDETMDVGDDQGEEQPALGDPITGLDNLEGMIDHLKSEQLDAITREDLWDANAMQCLILQFLEALRQSSGETLRNQCRERMVEVFTDSHRTATQQNRWESADRYQAMISLYGPDE